MEENKTSVYVRRTESYGCDHIVDKGAERGSEDITGKGISAVKTEKKTLQDDHRK